MLDVLAPAEPSEDLVLLRLPLVRDQQPDVGADDFVGRIAKDPLGTRIPAPDRPGQRLAQNRIRGRIHNRREMGGSFLLEWNVVVLGHSRHISRLILRSSILGSKQRASDAPPPSPASYRVSFGPGPVLPLPVIISPGSRRLVVLQTRVVVQSNVVFAPVRILDRLPSAVIKSPAIVVCLHARGQGSRPA